MDNSSCQQAGTDPIRASAKLIDEHNVQSSDQSGGGATDEVECTWISNEKPGEILSRLDDAGPFTFVAADALVLKVREGGRVVGVHALVATGVLISSFFLGSFFLQHVRGYGALTTGLLFLPVAVATNDFFIFVASIGNAIFF
mgnify:CR=1 FL=1